MNRSVRTANTASTARNLASRACFTLVVLIGVAISAVSAMTRVRAQPVPTSLPTTVVIVTSFPTTHPTSAPTTIVTTTSIPAIATTVPTTVPTTAPTTYPTTKPTTVPTIIPGTLPPTTPPPATPTPSGAPMLYGCSVFPANDWVFNTRIDSVPVDPQSAAMMNSYLSFVGSGATLSLSYAATYWFIAPATRSTAQYPLVQTLATGTPAPAGKPPITDFPFTSDMPWQGKGQAIVSDRHIMVLDNGNCTAYESYTSNAEPPPSWQVANNQLTQSSYYGGRWDLTQPYPSPSPRSGVNLGGLPQFAGMVRWEDWLSGSINHALNIDVRSHSMGGSVYPCNASIPLSYFNGTVTPPVPCGVHWRLQASYVLTCTCPQAQMIVTALKNYGAYLMDQGTPPGTIYLANYQQADGTWIVPWDANDVKNIAAIPMSALEIVPPPGCASIAACIKTTNTPYGLNPGVCPILPHWWRVQHRLLYARLCHPVRRHR